MRLAAGGCMCGAVRFRIDGLGATFGACHCEMCRRWTGSAFLGIAVPVEALQLFGQEHIGRLPSSAWAERTWCTSCGSRLGYRVLEGPMSTTYELPIGLLDDPNGLRLIREIYIDQKPDGFSYAGEHLRLTAAETFALYRPATG